jgi:hypothetical protein
MVFSNVGSPARISSTASATMPIDQPMPFDHLGDERGLLTHLDDFPPHSAFGNEIVFVGQHFGENIGRQDGVNQRFCIFTC